MQTGFGVAVPLTYTTLTGVRASIHVCSARCVVAVNASAMATQHVRQDPLLVGGSGDHREVLLSVWYCQRRALPCVTMCNGRWFAENWKGE